MKAKIMTLAILSILLFVAPAFAQVSQEQSLKMGDLYKGGTIIYMKDGFIVTEKETSQEIPLGIWYNIYYKAHGFYAYFNGQNVFEYTNGGFFKFDKSNNHLISITTTCAHATYSSRFAWRPLQESVTKYNGVTYGKIFAYGEWLDLQNLQTCYINSWLRCDCYGVLDYGATIHVV